MKIPTEHRHSRAWWGVFLFACLAMAIYLAFDLLDVDGSTMRDMGRGTAITAESVGSETDRLLPDGMVTGAMPDAVSAHSAPRLLRESPRGLPPLSLRTARRDSNIMRSRLSRDHSSDQLSEDPA